MIIATQGSLSLVAEGDEFWVEGPDGRLSPTADSPFVFLRHGVWSKVDGVAKHMGPGPHPSGTPQSVHGSGSKGTSGNKMLSRMSPGGDLREGFSITPIGGVSAEGGFMVAIEGTERRFKVGEVTAEDIASFRREHWAEFEDMPNSYWGGWFDTKNDEYVLDVSIQFGRVEAAVDAGRRWNQDAIYDLNHWVEIRTDDDGASFEEWKKEFT